MGRFNEVRENMETVTANHCEAIINSLYDDIKRNWDNEEAVKMMLRDMMRSMIQMWSEPNYDFQGKEEC
jgi:hypothetical protein